MKTLIAVIFISNLVFVRLFFVSNMRPNTLQKRYVRSPHASNKFEEVENRAEEAKYTTSPFTETSTEINPTKFEPSRNWNLIVLASVPAVWGTYAPALKNLYSSAELTPPGFLFNFFSYSVSVLTLSGIPWLLQSRGLISGAQEIPKSDPDQQRLTLRAGRELGILLFIGSNIQVLGIQGTSAARAGLLVQLTTVFVPLLEAIAGRPLPTRLWVASLSALVGVLFVSISHPLELLQALATGQGLPEGSGLSQGDVLVSLSAVFYSLHVLRLGKYTSRVTSVDLARTKALTEWVLSLVVIAIALLQGSEELQVYLAALVQEPQRVAVSVLATTCIWNGAVTTAYTMWAQTFGQKSVRPTQANLVYSSQPVWGLALASLGLGESVDGHALLGCLILLTAACVAQWEEPGIPTLT